jgi:hypothetical protein
MIIAEQRWHHFKGTVIAESVLPVYALKTMKVLQEEAMPDLTVGELLDQVDQLERAQVERKPMAEAVLELESKTKDWIEKVDNTIKQQEQDEGVTKSMQKLKNGMNNIIDSIGEVKKLLNDPEADMVEIGIRVKALFSEYKGKLMKNIKAIMNEVQLDDWQNLWDWTDGFFNKVEEIPGLNTIMGFTKDITKTLKWGAKGIKWLAGKFSGEPGIDPDEAIQDMVDTIAQKPDTKFKTSPFLELFNIDDEYIAMLDDELEVKFIEYYKEFLQQHADDVKIADLDIDSALENWIPKQSEYQDHGVENMGGQ